MQLTKATAMLAGTFMVAITQVLASPSPIPGYEIGPVTWTIPNGTDGTFIKLQGTVQEVDAQLARDHPHIKRDLVFDNGTSSAIVHAASDVSVAATPKGVPSQDWQKHAWCPDPGCCGYPLWQRANAYHILSGIDYLNSFKHEIGVTGPNYCGRVSCSYDSAIFWCNNHEFYLPFKNGKPLGTAANTIAANCYWTDQDSFPPESSVLGQYWSDDNEKGELGTNVVVRRDIC